MRLLELFSGTGSIGRAFAAEGWEVHSLDTQPGATIQSDILDWDYKALPPGRYDFIWASPPCTEYSKARTRAKRPRDMDAADLIVARTLGIIDWFKPAFWLMENPQTGFLKQRTVVSNIPFQDITYCRYGYPYKKMTRLWGLFPFALKPPCSREHPCENVFCGRHPQRAQRFHNGVRQSLEQLYSIPPDLCKDIAAIVTRWVQ